MVVVVLAAVAAVFINRDIKHVKYDDQMPFSERQASLKAFHGDIHVFLCTTQMYGIGMNLCACQIMFADFADLNRAHCMHYLVR